MASPVILLIDDHALVRLGMVAVLREAFPVSVIHEAASLADATHLLQSDLILHIVLTDLHLPDALGFGALSRVQSMRPDVPIVAISGSLIDENDLLQQAPYLAGFVSKTAPAQSLVEMIERVMAGNAHVITAAPLVRHQSLTEREKDVIQLCAQGLRNKEIGRRLGISENTVRAHLGTVFRRYGVRSRAEAALLSEQLGLSARALDQIVPMDKSHESKDR